MDEEEEEEREDTDRDLEVVRLSAPSPDGVLPRSGVVLGGVRVRCAPSPFPSNECRCRGLTDSRLELEERRWRRYFRPREDEDEVEVEDEEECEEEDEDDRLEGRFPLRRPRFPLPLPPRRFDSLSRLRPLLARGDVRCRSR